MTCGGVSCRSKTGGSCVQPEQICDGEIHCYDAKDEMNCLVEDAVNEDIATTENVVHPVAVEPETPACAEGQFTCSK